MLVWLLLLLFVLEPEWRPGAPAPAAIVASFLQHNINRRSAPQRPAMLATAAEHASPMPDKSA